MNYEAPNFTDTALSLDLPDDTLISTINELKAASDSYFGSKNIPKRRKTNNDAYTGEGQTYEDKPDYKSGYVDNVLYESLAYIKPIAMSRVPEFSVFTNKDIELYPEAQKNADDLTKVVNTVIKERANRKTVGIAFKHRPIKFIGIIKARWDPYMGKYGDYVFEAIDPDAVTLDHRAKFADPDKMQFVIHTYDSTLRDCVMQFPDSRDKIYAALKVDAKDYQKKANTPIKLQEVWFTDYVETPAEVDPVTGQPPVDDAGNPIPSNKWEKVECTIWKYENTIFGKMKNPYWDWQGHPAIKAPNPQDMLVNQIGQSDPSQMQVDDMGNPIQQAPLEVETLYRNYFSAPRKPFILLSYEQWGDGPLDITSSFEQSLQLQENINTTGRQITNIASRAKNKNVFSSGSGVTKENIEDLNLDDPDNDIMINGDLNSFYKAIPGEQPSNALFQLQQGNRDRLFAKMGTNSTTRGEVVTDTAQTANLSREADYGRIDDETEETINNAYQQIAEWSLHFIKLFYQEEQLKRVAGKDGERAYIAINSDMVEDGMEAEIIASGVDKALAQARAMQLLSAGQIDPVTLMQDLGTPHPKERAQMLMDFQLNPREYYVKYVLGQDPSMMQQIDPNTGQPVQQQDPATGQPVDPNMQAAPQAQDATMVQSIDPNQGNQVQ